MDVLCDKVKHAVKTFNDLSVDVFAISLKVNFLAVVND